MRSARGPFPGGSVGGAAAGGGGPRRRRRSWSRKIGRVTHGADPGPADPLVIAGETVASRLFIGTGGMSSLAALESVLVASGASLATVAVRRVDPSGGDLSSTCWGRTG